jgi:hypothetical protein
LTEFFSAAREEWSTAERGRVKGRMDDERCPLPKHLSWSPIRRRDKEGFKTNIQICKLGTQTDNVVGFMFGIAENGIG